MATGTVKFFDGAGYGFLIADDGGEELPISTEGIRQSEFREGEKVSYDVRDGKAINVTPRF